MGLKKVDAAINKAEIESNLPYHLLRVGLTCNVSCVFCNIPIESGSHPPNLDFNKIKKIISDIFKKDTYPKVSITGGEPTIRPDLINIIKYLKKRRAKIIELQTNAIGLADENLTARLKKAGLDKAFVSLHSHIPHLHDILVKEKNGYEKCIKGITNLLKYKIKVILNPVVTTLTYRHLPDYIRFVNGKLPEINSISLSVVQPNGRAMMKQKIIPRYSVISSYIKEALDLADQFNIIVNNPYCGLPLCIGEWYKRLDRCVEYNESMAYKNKITNFRRPEVSEKIKSQQCRLCDLDEFCNGVWRNYAKLYPLTDLKPIKKKFLI